MNKKKLLEKVAIPAISVLLALVAGSLVLLISGINPLILFEDMFKSTAADPNRWLLISSMLVFTGLSVGFSYRGGLFNIGAEGQFIMSSLFVCYFAYNSNLPAPIIPIVGILLGFIIGALWAFLPGFLKASYNISEVVVTIMLNWIAMYFSDFIIVQHYHQAKSEQSTPILPLDHMLTIHIGDQVINYGFIFGILAILAYWFILEKTTLGFEIKAIGSSPSISEYTGISAKARIIQTMMISGGFAGISGAIYSLSYPSIYSIGGAFTNYGFDGIAVALLGGLNGFGIMFSGMLLGALRNAEAALSIDRVASEITDIIIALIILFCIIGPIIYKKIKKRGA